METYVYEGGERIRVRSLGTVLDEKDLFLILKGAFVACVVISCDPFLWWCS